jgi:branched-chain amino acid transport system permease protein
MSVYTQAGEKGGEGDLRDVLAVERRRSVLRSVTVVAILLAGFSVYAIRHGGLQLYVQRVIDGTTNGMLYGAIAMALVLVFMTTKTINFAQGAMATMGAFIAWQANAHWGLPGWASILAAMALTGLGGAVIERTLIRPFDPDNHLAIVLVTLGLYLAINALVGYIWGFDPRGFPNVFPHAVNDYVSIAGARLYYDHIGTAIAITLMVVVVQLLLTRTKLGLAMRSVASSVESSRLIGIDVGHVIQAAWALAAASGTLAACLIAPTTYLEPGVMDTVLVYGFAAATLGGLDSPVGAVIGGVIVGLTVSLVTGYIPALGSQFSLTTAFLVIIAVLQFKPGGLFGRHVLERV